METPWLWVCTADGAFVRADSIVTISVVGGDGHRARSSDRGDLRIVAELPGGTEGDTLTRHQLGRCPAPDAEQLAAGLLQAICDAAAGDGPRPVFIHRDPEEAAWAVSHELPAGRIVVAERPGWPGPV